MAELVPNRLLFRFEVQILYRVRAPRIDGDLADWDERYVLPPLAEIDNRPVFTDLHAAWNERGLSFAYRIAGRRRPLQIDTQRFWRSDGLRICTDTRDTRSLRRATRFWL